MTLPISELVGRYDNKAGFDVVDYSEIFLPLFRVKATLLTREETPTIMEFLLRTVDAGIQSPGEIAQFLGLARDTTVNALADLQQAGGIKEQVSGRIQLTPIGIKMMNKAIANVPMEASYEFLVDGFTRRPCWVDPQDCYKPRYAKQQQKRILHGFPRRKPLLEDIGKRELSKFIASRPNMGRKFRLIEIKEITRTETEFQEALMLIYKSANTEDIAVNFLIDGRPSPDHDRIFQEKGGLDRLGLRHGVERNRDVVDFFHKKGQSGKEILDLAVDNSKKAKPILSTINEAKKEAERAKRGEQYTRTRDEKNEFRELNRTKIELIEEHQEKLQHFPERRLSVYEHPSILRDAVEQATEQLIIISPWITTSVINDHFIELLDSALTRGVNLYIGYGLGNSTDKPGQREAVKRLETLSSKHNELFILKRFGDTHAKVLIKDSEFYVITSFNWLSFAGDPDKKFREEWGVQISRAESVESFRNEWIPQFKPTLQITG